MRTLKNSEQLWSTIGSGKSIVLVGHANPDGDAIGSVSAMYHFLKQLGKQACMIVPNSFPDFLSCLDSDTDPILIYRNDTAVCKQKISDSDLVICLDMSGPSRIDDLADDIFTNSSARKILIDHHLNPVVEAFDIVVSDTEVSSTCELLFSLILESSAISGDITGLSLECANSIAAGILTDTNNFANSIFPATLERFSQLLKRGVDRDRLYNEIFCSYSATRMELMGYLLSEKMTLIHDGTVAFIILDKSEKEKYSFRTGDSEGFVNLPLKIRKVCMSALLTEDDGFVKVSLRSKGDLDVNRFAREYCNGGGHRNASGGRLYISIDETPDYFTNSIEEYFKKA
ncbi:MAG: DHH family phosphoesterase [Bacteroidales bacterium]|nr:DHH family phosphoesterase [Bacteroidales bacterium]